MAIVLEVSLTLNPNNQIAYLADFTSLQEDTEYVITGTYLNYDTRFVFHGFFDITLTKPPIGVPASGTIVPAEISTVPQAAPPPIPATYPYSANERIIAANLNAELEFNPAVVPPHGNLGGAGKFKYWVDTSTPQPSLRQCIVPRASPTYNAAEWLTLGTIDAAAGKFHFNGTDVDFVGGEGGGTTIFNVTNLTVQGNTNLTTLVVTGATNLTTLQVSGGTTLTTLNVSGATTLSSLNVTGALTGTNETLTGDLTALGVRYTGLSGNRFAFSWSGHVEAYVDGGHYGTIPSSLPLPISEGGTQATSAAQGLANLGGFPAAGGTISGSLGVTGNLQVNGNINCSRIDADYVYSRGNMAAAGQFNSNTVYTNYISSAGGCDVAGTVGAGGFSTGGVIYAGNNFNGPYAHFSNATIDGTITSGRLSTSSGDQWLGPGGAGRILQMQNGWYWEFNSGNGDMVWGGPSGAQFWVIRYSDHYCGNQIGPVFGSTFITTSDDRGKTDITPANQGLAEILQLKPVTFKRTDQDRVELGFTAQDVQQILPEAVWPLDDRLGVSLDPIVATLVNAVQQLARRVEQLEA